MRTRDRMYLGRIRSVRDISQDDRARIATGSLRTPTDRLMENYSIDGKEFKALTSNLVNLNAQGLTNKYIFLKALLESHDVDTCCITETWRERAVCRVASSGTHDVSLLL